MSDSQTTGSGYLPMFNVRAKGCFVADSKQVCWKCGKDTKVFGIMVPPLHERKIDVEDTWEAMDTAAFITNVEFLPPEIIAKIQRKSSRYWVDYSRAEKKKYWMNHCDSCGVKQGDFYLYMEPEGAFFHDQYTAPAVLLWAVEEDFICCGEPLYGDHSYEYMTVYGRVEAVRKLLLPVLPRPDARKEVANRLSVFAKIFSLGAKND